MRVPRGMRRAVGWEKAPRRRVAVRGPDERERRRGGARAKSCRGDWELVRVGGFEGVGGLAPKRG